MYTEPLLDNKNKMQENRHSMKWGGSGSEGGKRLGKMKNWEKYNLKPKYKLDNRKYPLNFLMCKVGIVIIPVSEGHGKNQRNWCISSAEDKARRIVILNECL